MTRDEIKELNEIVSRYKDIDGEMLDIKEKVEAYKKRNGELIEELRRCEEMERAFTQKMMEKYGELDYNDLMKYII